MNADVRYAEELLAHYAKFWGAPAACRTWDRGPASRFRCLILSFPPGLASCWVYASSGMSASHEPEPIELFLLSPHESEPHVELLTAVADYHRTGAKLAREHTVNFGRAWIEGSRCDHGLVSLPYPFGPRLERAQIAGRDIQVLWLLPITRDERDFKIRMGIEALESLFETRGLDAIDPMRASVVDADSD